MRPAVAALLLLAACSQTRPRVISTAVEPSARVVSITSRQFDRQRAELQIALEITNPGADLRLYGADFEVFTEDRLFASGRTGLYGQVQALGTATVTVPIYLAYRDAPAAARQKARNGQPVRIVARGTVDGLAVLPTTIPFDGEAELTLSVDEGS